MSDVDVAALRALAEAATPGPWVPAEWDGTTVITARWADETTDPDERGPFACIGAANERDATFIAAANPTAVLALLDTIARVEALAEEWAAERDAPFGAAHMSHGFAQHVLRAALEPR